ncbi:hypothetical protein FJ492_25645 [Mesorhizobium sp. B2-5-4]|uniref:hypothetical protein n=1 Tax=Mesorhizobium sp. B2-5-4 TaxID=2589926 RepID=UPI0011286376|nr:hypothetical protein [Mesorhizobium sp. B2-5-4]TPK35984.1 hypothetical protein FJ492_25645 [Mesorhizobium sp. B2-5-4]
MAMRDFKDFDDPCPQIRVPNRASVMKTTRRDAGRQVEANPSSKARAVDDALLERTVQLFEARSGRSLSKEDRHQIVENVSGFFRILPEWRTFD